MIFNYLNKKCKESDFFGAGLVLGGFMGLVLLVSILMEDLIFGLIFIPLAGVIFGVMAAASSDDLGKEYLLGGLGYLITSIFSIILILIFLYFPSSIPTWLLIIVGITIVELFFWFDKQKPKKKQNKFWFTASKKIEAILETIAVAGILNLIRLGIKELLKLKINWEVVITWIGYIGIGISALVLLIGIIWSYIKLNSLKYQK